MKNKFNQEFTGFPFDKAHKYASEERIIQNHLMGDRAGIVPGYDRAAATSTNGLNITVDPFLAMIKGGWFRSHQPIVVPVLPNSSGVIVAQLNLAEYNESVGIIDDGSYQYALNQVRVLDIGQKEPTREDILTSGLKYEIEICRYASTATTVSLTDTREYVMTQRDYIKLIGRGAYQSAVESHIGGINGEHIINPVGVAKRQIRYIDPAYLAEGIDAKGWGTLTNKSPYPIMVEFMIVASIGIITPNQTRKYNIGVQLHTSSLTPDTSYGLAATRIATAGRSITAVSSHGYTNNQPSAWSMANIAPGQTVYFIPTVAVYGTAPADVRYNSEVHWRAYITPQR